MTTADQTSRGPRTRDGHHVGTVHDQLRAAILRGELEAGATIPQGRLASEFGAGRTPLREALRLLEREGLVVSEPNRPVRIASLSADDYEALCISRIALEGVAIRITVPLLGSDDVAELEGCMAQMDHYRKTDDVRGFRVPHRAFHRALIAGSGPRVTAEISEIADHKERYMLAFGGYREWEETRAEHRAILDAAAAGDPDLAAERLAEHYAKTASLVFEHLAPDYDLGRLRTTIWTVAPGAEKALHVG
jgi:GntR family transcriptional regulator, rspAB operon transcriptional repressor